MNITATLRHSVRGGTFALMCFLCAAIRVFAQSIDFGTLSGRVHDSAAGRSLEKARVTVDGTNRETFTDAFGEYRLSGLPAGDLALTVFYTGLVPQTATVRISPGGATQRDFALAAASTTRESAPGEGVLLLDQFVVAAARETNAATIAVNEQRFAGNLKSVVSTDALGIVGENNIGEFVKYLPGVDVGTDQMNAVTVSLRGLPAAYTSIAVDGEVMNSAGSAAPGRSTLLQTLSLANAARIEIYKVPTPDLPASSLGGSINLVSRTAFEASKPEFRYKVFLNKNSHDFTFGREYGGGDGDDQAKVFHHQPDFDLTYTVPISKTFGFSINALKSDQFNVSRRITRTFSTTTLATNPLRATIDNPFLTTLSYLLFPIMERRYSLGMRFDWKLSPVDTLSLSYSGNYFQQDIEAFTFTANTGTNPISWGPDFTHGRPGSGTVTVANLARHFWVRNHIFRLNYRHLGSHWDVTGGLGYNFSTKIFRAISHRQLETASGQITGAAIDIDGYDATLPRTLTVRNAAGASLDPFDLRSYNFFVNGATGARDSAAHAKSAKVDATRKFFTDRLRSALRTGAFTREEFYSYRMSSFNPVYVGPDGRAASGDEGITRAPANLLNVAMLSYEFPRGFPTPQFPSTRRAWELWEQQPSLFDTNANRRTDLQTDPLNATEITERIDAAYLMGDVSLLKNRLRVVAGFRFERTTDDGRAVLQDNNAKYQRNPTTGALLLDAQKRPILIPSVATDLIAQDALVYKKLGAHFRKTYDGIYPSLNASYNLTENVIGRIGLARTVGRPDFANLLGAANVNQLDFDPGSSNTGATLGTIVTKNPALKPWTADNLDLHLEYYTKNGGEISGGFFRKQIKNFFANRTFLATPDFLESISLGNEFTGFQVTAPYNTEGLVHVNGWEFNVSQPLGSLTPIAFARHFRVFANSTMIRTKGGTEADFRGFAPLIVNWGFHFNRRALAFVGKWNLVGKKRLAPAANTAALGAIGWNYQKERLRFDASLDYQLTRRFSFYVTGRNIFNDRDQTQFYAAGSPRYVRLAGEGEYGVTMQFGIKGAF
jgi:iron complex outermembrane receptor protein